MTTNQFNSSPPTSINDNNGESGNNKKKRALASTAAPRQQQAVQSRRRRLFVEHNPQTTLYEQWCCDVVTDRPIVLRSSQREQDDAILTQCTLPSSFLSETQPLPPRIVFFLERCDHNNVIAWRQMLTFDHRLRSLTSDVFPLLHERLIAVYWCRPRTAATSARAYNKHGALFSTRRRSMRRTCFIASRWCATSWRTALRRSTTAALLPRSTSASERISRLFGVTM